MLLLLSMKLRGLSSRNSNGKLDALSEKNCNVRPQSSDGSDGQTHNAELSMETSAQLSGEEPAVGGSNSELQKVHRSSWTD